MPKLTAPNALAQYKDMVRATAIFLADDCGISNERLNEFLTEIEVDPKPDRLVGTMTINIEFAMDVTLPDFDEDELMSQLVRVIEITTVNAIEHDSLINSVENFQVVDINTDVTEVDVE